MGYLAGCPAGQLDTLYHNLEAIQHIRNATGGADSASAALGSKILAERPFFQACKVETMNVFDQRDKSARTMIERGLALVERPGGRVPDGTARMKVLRHPAEAR